MAARQVTEYKHSAYNDRLNDDRLADMKPEALAEFVREMEGFQSGITKSGRRTVIGLLYRQVHKDNDLFGLAF